MLFLPPALLYTTCGQVVYALRISGIGGLLEQKLWHPEPGAIAISDTAQPLLDLRGIFSLLAHLGWQQALIFMQVMRDDAYIADGPMQRLVGLGQPAQIVEKVKLGAANQIKRAVLVNRTERRVGVSGQQLKKLIGRFAHLRAELIFQVRIAKRRDNGPARMGIAGEVIDGALEQISAPGACHGFGQVWLSNELGEDRWRIECQQAQDRLQVQMLAKQRQRLGKIGLFLIHSGKRDVMLAYRCDQHTEMRPSRVPKACAGRVSVGK